MAFRRSPKTHAPGVLTIAVATDFHAFDELDGGKRPSHLCVTDPDNEPNKHPIAALHELIRTTRVVADLFLLGGDFAHKARPAGVQYAWAKAHEIAKALKAKLTAATSGNHDLDSRYSYTKYDAKGILQTLIPRFPLPTESHCDKYWARHFVVVERPPYRLVVLNSSAFHGTAPDEIAHGRVSDHTLDALRTALDTTENQSVNILLCHHHPQQHMELRLGDYDVMKNGQLLLDLLGTGRHGRWLLVHGHKHHPKITYASGGATAPVIFSAGSLCAELYLELQSRARNQFYVVTLPYSKFPALGFVGTIRAWDWASGVGWIRAGSSSGLPWLSGFGCRADASLLASKIAATVRGVVQWDTLVAAHPEIEYLLPQDAGLLYEDLSKSHRLSIVRDTDGLPLQIGEAT